MFRSDFKKLLNFSSWRSYFLAMTAISINLVVVCPGIFPNIGDRSVADFKFPQRIELASGKAMSSISGTLSTSIDTTQSESDEPETSEIKSEIVKAYQKYQIQQQQNLTVEISYLVDTRGDVEIYLQRYTSIPPENIKTKQIEQIEGVGYYALLNSKNRAYLSSCISPRSLSNVTQRQFSQYRYQNDLNPKVGWNWLRGKASIRDRRCLWVHLSTPLGANPQASDQILEQTWQDLYQWWLPNFPSLL